jgi:hypothetical protein
VSGRFWLWLHRPLADRERRRLFLLAAGAIVAAAVALELLTQSPEHHPAGPTPRHHTAQPLDDLEPRPAAPLPLEVDPGRAPSEEGQPTAARVPRAVSQAAKAVARRFLAGYLPYTYGQADPASIKSATRELRRRLATERPRVPPGVRHRHPRVVLVQSVGVSDQRAAIDALVNDGTRTYTVSLELAHLHGAWIVTEVGVPR